MKYVNVEESNVGTAKVMYTLSLRNQHYLLKLLFFVRHLNVGGPLFICPFSEGHVDHIRDG